MRFRFRRLVAASMMFTCALLSTAPSATADTIGTGYTGHNEPTPYVMPENQAARHETHRIRILNDFYGAIEISTDQGANWTLIGSVAQPAVKNNPVGYSAARWSEDGDVAATATNAIHIKVAERYDDPTLPSGRASLFSIIPRQFFNPPPDYGSYKPAGAGIYTNIDSGTYIFSHEWAPYVGDRVYLEEGGALVELPENYAPQPGDQIVLVVTRPVLYPAHITFENWEGGRVMLTYQQGKAIREKQIGTVWARVRGVGRFEGSTYPGNSRVRANHNGVIDVTTAPAFHGALGDADDENKGGFQIVPIHHAFQGQSNPRAFSQWMVIAPISDGEPSPDGIAPLFSGYIRPRYEVQAKLAGSDQWVKLPEITGLQSNALADLTHLRIHFPQEAPLLPLEIEAPQFDPLPESTETSPLTVTGSALPGARVSISRDGAEPVLVYATADGRFEASISLIKGSNNVIQAWAQDPAGRTSPEVTVEVYMDQTLNPPVLEQPKSLTKAAALKVMGTADPSDAVRIYLNGDEAGTVQPAAGTGQFSLNLTLAEGMNEIYAVAVTPTGESVPSDTIRVQLDSLPPEFLEFQPGEGGTVIQSADGTVLLRARADGTGTRLANGSIKVDGVNRSIAFANADEGTQWISTRIPLAPGQHTIAFYVVDQATNALRYPAGTAEYTFFVEAP